MQVIRANLLEIVFRGRLKDYGAYDLRKRSSRIIMLAFIFSSVGFAAVMSAPVIIQRIKDQQAKEAAKKVEVSTEVSLADAPPPDKSEPPPPPPPEPPPPPKQATVKFVPPKAVEKEEEESKEPPKEQTEVEDKTTGKADVEGEDDLDDMDFEPTDEGPKEVKDPPKPVAEPDPFKPHVGEEPKPVNMDEVKQLIGYPPIAVESGIEGTVIVRVLVDADGKYVKHLLITDEKKVHPILIKAVQEKVNLVRFTPGTQAGKPVPVWVNIPFKFKLKN